MARKAYTSVERVEGGYIVGSLVSPKSIVSEKEFEDTTGRALLDAVLSALEKDAAERANRGK